MILHHFQNGPFLNSKMEMGREKLSSTEIWILVSTVCSNLKFWSNCNFDTHPVPFLYEWTVELGILSVKCKAIPQFWLTTIHIALLHDFLQIVIVRLDDVKTQTNFLTSRFLLRTEYEPRFIVIKEVISKGRSFLQCYFVPFTLEHQSKRFSRQNRLKIVKGFSTYHRSCHKVNFKIPRVS